MVAELIAWVAPRARHGELGVDDVDGDDRMGAGEVGELDHVEADAADAEHHHRFADLDLGVVVDDAGRGGDRAAEQGGDLEVVVRRDHRHAVFRDHRVFIEGGDPTGVELPAAPQVGRRRALDAEARPPVQHHGIVRLDRGDAGSGFEHRRRRLVSEQMRQEFVRPLGGGDFIDLGAADRRVQHLDQYLPGGKGVGQGDLVDHQGLARLDQNRRLRCLDLHRPAPPFTRNR